MSGVLGTGSGIYGILVVAIVAVFIAGLMVGRTPEYLHKKITGREIKLVSLYILATPMLVLAGTGLAMGLSAAKASILNPGPHGLSEVLYAFMSAANNNGSAFAGLSANTGFYNVALGLVMLGGRLIPIVFVVEVGAAGCTVLAISAPTTFAWWVTIWLWLTVIFANLAEAVAEGRGKAQAA